jgi:hypothetical protein
MVDHELKTCSREKEKLLKQAKISKIYVDWIAYKRAPMNLRSVLELNLKISLLNINQKI